MFSEVINGFYIQNQMPQQQLVAALDIDTVTYCKIKKGERKVKKKKVSVLSKLFHVNSEHLLTLWFVDQVPAVVSNDPKIAPKA